MLLSRTHPLPSGDRVRLRLARPGDREALAGFLGLEPEEMEIRRLLRRWGLVATLWDGESDVLAGFGGLSEHGPAVVADDPDVYLLLERALDEHAQAWSRRVA
jgi:hypothetical protein